VVVVFVLRYEAYVEDRYKDSLKTQGRADAVSIEMFAYLLCVSYTSF